MWVAAGDAYFHSLYWAATTLSIAEPSQARLLIEAPCLERGGPAPSTPAADNASNARSEMSSTLEVESAGRRCAVLLLLLLPPPLPWWS